LRAHICESIPVPIPTFHLCDLWSKSERILTAPTFHLMKGCEMPQNVVECGGVAELALGQFKSVFKADTGGIVSLKNK